MPFSEIIQDDSGIERCQELLEVHFADKNHKNPRSDAYLYCRAIRLFREFLVYMHSGKETAEAAMKTAVPECNKRRKADPDIPRPSCSEARFYIERWESLENYRLQENALNKLFLIVYPKNVDLDDVLIKVSALNDFYSTNIFSPLQVARHIVALGIDKRLQAADSTLVNDLSAVKMEKGLVKNFYSFATKYCSHHRPLEYPIYDSYVERLLRYFRDVDGFAKFENSALRGYASFKDILLQFRQFYQLEQFNLKEIDKYLWQLGKLKFPKNYRGKDS